MSEKNKATKIILVILSFLIQSVLILAIFGGSIYIAKDFIKKRPKAKKRKIAQKETLVKTEKLKQINHNTVIETMGTVIPSCQIDIFPQVGGMVVEMSPELIPGGILKKNQKIIKIDDRDYKLTLAQKKSAIEIANSDLLVEQGKQTVAQREYQMLGKDLSDKERNLVLRKPYLISYEEKIKSAEAAWKQANINLERTKITAPFNAMVIDKNIAEGSIVGSSSKIANIVAIDEFWIEVSIPLDRISWIIVPKTLKDRGSKSKIINLSWQKDKFRHGYVKKLLPSIETQGRMAKILVAVEDPLCTKEENKKDPILLLNSFVRVRIKGKKLENVIEIPNSCLHEGNIVWIKNKESKLEIRKLDILWQERFFSYVKEGVKKGEDIIVNEVPGAVDGMPVVDLSTLRKISKENKKEKSDSKTKQENKDKKKENLKINKNVSRNKKKDRS